MDGWDSTPFDAEAARLQADFAAAREAQPALPARYQFYFNMGGTSLTAESAGFIPASWTTSAAAARPQYPSSAIPIRSATMPSTRSWAWCARSPLPRCCGKPACRRWS